MVWEYLFNSTSANYQIDNLTERKEKRKGFGGFGNPKKYSCAWPVRVVPAQGTRSRKARGHVSPRSHGRGFPSTTVPGTARYITPLVPLVLLVLLVLLRADGREWPPMSPGRRYPAGVGEVPRLGGHILTT